MAYRYPSGIVEGLVNLTLVLLVLEFSIYNGDSYRSLVISPVIDGKALINHTIRTIQPIADEYECATHCYMEPLCFTFNLCHKTGKSPRCELTNSDHIRHEKDLVSKAGCGYYGSENACSSSPCSKNATCQGDYPHDSVPYKCICPAGFEGDNCEKDIDECTTDKHNCHVNATCINNCSCKSKYYGDGITCCWVIFDFETGENALKNWNRTGTVFDNQPTYGDNPKARKREPSNHKGDWWIGGAENRPNSSWPPRVLQGETGDEPQGTMTSPPFVIQGFQLRFLIGGGCKIEIERAELLIGGNVVAKETGRQCFETMETREWNVEGYHGQEAQIRLVDNSSGSWGHLNFDHLEGILCIDEQ